MPAEIDLIAQVKAALTLVPAAINASYALANAECHHQNRTAEKHGLVIEKARATIDAALPAIDTLGETLARLRTLVATEGGQIRVIGRLEQRAEAAESALADAKAEGVRREQVIKEAVTAAASAADRATRWLDDDRTRNPSRAHVEGLRNNLNDLARSLRAALGEATAPTAEEEVGQTRQSTLEAPAPAGETDQPDYSDIDRVAKRTVPHNLTIPRDLPMPKYEFQTPHIGSDGQTYNEQATPAPEREGEEAPPWAPDEASNELARNISAAFERHFASQQEETGWLIELPATPDTHASWWHPERGWSKDASRAIRYARQEDAVAAIKAERWFTGAVATEHKWMGAASPAAPDGGVK